MPRKSPQQKAAATRRRQKRARQWRKAYGVEIEIGYNGGQMNSYTMIIRIRPYKRIDDDQIADLCETLAHTGHFNNPENRRSYSGSLTDFTWVSINDWDVIERGFAMTRGTARLIGFERRKPGLLAR